MSDPLDDLRAEMARATPAPDAEAKARALAAAEKEFDRRQGSADGARPISDRPRFWAGIGKGVGHMISTLSTRGALAAGTAIVAVGLVLTLPDLRDALLPPVTEISQKTTDADDAPVPVDAVDERRERVATLTEEEAPPAPVIEPMLAPEPELSLAAPSPAPATGASEAYRGVAGGALDTMTATAPEADRVAPPEEDTEAYANAEPNPVHVVGEEPVSTFSVDVDTASWAVVRSSLMRGQMPPPDAVRIEELINYFNYDWPAPGAGEAPFRATVSVTDTPWNAGTELLTIGLKGRMPAVEDRPPLNLVFLIDTSGSMQDADKLPLLKQSFRLMLSQLRPEDQVAIVTYAGSAGQVLTPTPASERSTILSALERLEAGGSTAGQAGLMQAYAAAEGMTDDGEVTRVILATDGDFNVGISDPEELKDYIETKRDTGIYLSVLGFGRGNLDDATMQALAQNGNGTAAYIDTLNEARKVLVDQLTGALFPIADDVKIQVEFNPAKIAEYRLIGYETRALRREDFNNDRVDAGEIGAGHTVTAIYEITPVGSDAVLNDPLRYGAADTGAETGPGHEGEIAFLRLRYKEPGEDTSRLIEVPIAADAGSASDDTRFAAAIAGFGQLLQGGDYIGDWSWGDAIALATSAQGDDPFGYRREAVSLMRLAESLSQ